MAHEIPPQFRAVLNPRELPTHRVERLWALHAELSTPQGLLLASAWLPPAWPFLLQLLADPHPEVRAAATQLLGHLGAALAGRRELRLAARMPPSALLDWGLALLSPASTLPAAQRMTSEAKEAGLLALHVCVAAMPPPDVAPFAQPLLRLTTALLEATTTPPRLLGPLLRLLLAALPAVPLPALGQGFGDLADLLCGWALEPLVAAEDRHLITLILHALRPQWHSHPDLTASLTENMLNDVKAAAASAAEAAAVAAAGSGGGNGTDAAAQAASCMQLVQLLCDIFSAASLRQLSLDTGQVSVSGPEARPQDANSRGPFVLPQPVAIAVSSPAGRATQAYNSLAAQRHQLRPLQQQYQQQYQQEPARRPGPQPHAASALPAPQRPPAPPLALTAILPTRPGAATVQHLVGLYPRLLATLKDVRESLVKLDAAALPSAEAWPSRLCGCVEALSDSVGSCAVGIDPRDLDEVWEGLGRESVLGRLAALTLNDDSSSDHDTVSRPKIGVAGVDATAASVAACSSAAASDVACGVVGSVAAVAAPEAIAGGSSTGGAGGAGAGTTSYFAPAAQSRGAALRMGALLAALRWALEALSGVTGGGDRPAGARRWPRVAGPGPDAEALAACAVRFLEGIAGQDERVGRRLLVELVLEGREEGVGVGGLRSAAQTAAVAAGGKLLHSLLCHENNTISAATLNWLLEDLKLHALKLQQSPPVYLPSSLMPAAPRAPPTSGCEGAAADAAAAVTAFDCAVLQAACQRGWLAGGALILVEGALWEGLSNAAVPAPPALLEPLSSAAPESGQVATAAAGDASGASELASASVAAHQPGRQVALPDSVTLALCDAWGAAATALIAAVHIAEQQQQQPDAQPSAAGQHRPSSGNATRACCAAFLHAVHSLQSGSNLRHAAGRGVEPKGMGAGTNLRLRALAALRHLLSSPTVAASGALRRERLFRQAVDVVSAGAASWDARIRTAAADCATALVSHVLLPSPPFLKVETHAASAEAAGAGAVVVVASPRPEAFAPLAALAMEGLADASADVAAAGARLAAELSEASLLATLRGPGACSAWVPAWQDALAVTPQLRVPRSQQVARLLELVFQGAAVQGSVLLRKRNSGASAAAGSGGGSGNEDGDAGGRMEALQRLALGMLSAHVQEQPDAGGGGGVDGYGGGGGAAAAAAVAEGRSGAALVWLALQEGAKHLVASRLRTHLGGPTQTLGALERMLQVTYARLSQERHDAGAAGVGASARESAWLALELVGALERSIAHAAEGYADRDALPPPVLAFFAANRRVCAEWFTRARELLARLASLAAVHHAAATHGLLRLRDMRASMRQLLASLAKERGKAAAAAATAATPAGDAKSGSTFASSITADGGAAASAAVAVASGAAGAAPSQAGQAAAVARQGIKQLQRRAAAGTGGGGEVAAVQQPPKPLKAVAAVEAAPRGHGATAAAAPTAAASGGCEASGEEAAPPPSAVQQLELSLSRLTLAVVEVLKLVGGALLAMGEADSLQGMHAWAVREFEPLLQGAHTPGASAIAAATAAAAAEALAAGEGGLGSARLGASKRRQEATRASRAGSASNKHKDAFAWLLGLSLQAAGSYEQALLSYNAFLAPAQQAPPASANAAGSPQGGGGGHGGVSLPVSALSVALDVAAAAQGFVVERVAECYAALTDWSGLQGLVGAFTRTMQVEPAVAGWWPAAAASIEHKFRALAAFDTAAEPSGPSGPTGAPGDANSTLLVALRVLEGAAMASHPAVLSQPQARQRPPPPQPGDLAAARQAAALEFSHVLERLCASALSEPAAQRELLLQASCLRGALRALDAAPAATSAAEAPWSGLLLPQTLRSAPDAGGPTSSIAGAGPGHGSRAAFAFGLGRALLAPDGGLQSGVLRDVAVTAALLRAARASDPWVGQPGTQALSLEHIRSAAAAGNWSLAVRLVQAAAARAGGPPDTDGLSAGGCTASGAGARAVLSVVHSLMSAASGRLLPGQVVELQLRALLSHLVPPLSQCAGGGGGSGGGFWQRGGDSLDADDLACALCTLARWMLKAGAATHHHHRPPPGPHAHPTSHPGHHAHYHAPSHALQQHTPSQPPRDATPLGFSPQSLPAPQHHAPPGFEDATATPAGRPLPGMPAAPEPQWQGAADWPALSSQLLRQLLNTHAGDGGARVDVAAAAVGHRPKGDLGLAFLVPESLLQSCCAPAACCLRALQLSPGSARAWKAWGDLLYRATKEQRARAGRPPPSVGSPAAAAAAGGSSGGADARGAWAAVGYGAAAVAYCRYLTLSYSHEAAARPEDVLPVLLQVLHIVVRHAEPIEALLEEQLGAVPPQAWAAITPQLLAQLPGAAGASRRLLGLLLHAVGRAAPSLVLYPAVVEVRAADAAAAAAAAGATGGDGAAGDVSSSSSPFVQRGGGRSGEDSMLPELRALLADLGRSSPGLLPGVEVLVAEMERLTVLWDERWAALLAEVEVEIARRAVSLQAEAARVAEDASLTSEQRRALLASRYATLMAPAVVLLERQLRATAAVPPETPHERRFASSMLPRLRSAAAALRDGAGVRDWARPAPAWAPLRAAGAALARQQRQTLPPMAELSPRLAALQGSDVPMPGCHSGDGSNGGSLVPWGGLGQPTGAQPAGPAGALASSPASATVTVTVAGVRSELVALSTKTRPKRVALLGSDGRTYTYLLKGREDLRMDERLMQVLRAINAMLQADPAAVARGLATVRCYSVTPLGPRAGLIQWVPATTSLFAVFRQWQAATLERHDAMVAARQEGVAKAAAEGAPPPPEVEPLPPAAGSRPMDLFYSQLVAALQERGLSSATPRRSWPADLLRAVFASLAASSPRQLLARVLWAGGGSAALSWRRQQCYGRSLAVMSCVGHLLGLGDRHPDNILLEGREAGVVHIDYNVCWDKGAKLRVPEVVPFRLTQMLSAALGVGGLEGGFRAACETTLTCLRRRREALVGLADAVLSDPGVDWAVEREDMAARQDMELAVALNLFVSRAEEAQRQLQQGEEELPVVLEGPVGVLLSYVEAQAFGEAMRGAAAEARQRIQQAKSALEAASRAEAEAGAIVAAAAQEAASLAAEASALNGAVPQLLQQCGAWAQQHAATLGTLRDGSFLEGALASGASWRAVDSGAALGLLVPVQGPGHAPLTAGLPLALLPAALGPDVAAGVMGQLPEELLMACHDCDRQAADLLARREAVLYEAIGALTQYGTIVRKLLPPAYPASSYHHRWARALAALAAGGLSLPTVAQAQALAPREPRPLDIAAAWQALRGAQRLATAAALLLAPGSADAAAAVAGLMAGRELAGAVAAACKTLVDTAAVVAADARTQALAAASDAANRGVKISPDSLTRTVMALLQRHRTLQHHPQQQRLAAAASLGGAADAPVVAAAAAQALLPMVRASAGRLAALLVVPAAADGSARTERPSSEHPAAGLHGLLRLGSEVAGLASVASALAEARLAAPVLGVVASVPSAGPGSGSLREASRRAPSERWEHMGGDGGAGDVAGCACPLPWLAAAVGACGRWPELLQRLAADVAPELAGQLHLGGGSGGGSGAGGGNVPAAFLEDTPLVQAAADLQALLRPVEEALFAGRDAHTRLEALTELTATYPDRREDLTRRLAGPLAPSERESLESDLQALDAAWASRDAVAGCLAAAAAAASEALAEALRRLYAAVLGPGRLPAELQAGGGAAAAAAVYSAAATAGVEGWAEAGGCGHAAVAVVAAWWDTVTESLEGVHYFPMAGGGAGAEPSSCFEAPAGMRPLWRCVEVARLLGQSLRVCGEAVVAARLRLAAGPGPPTPGTDGALSEAYSAVMQALARRAAEHLTARLLPHLRHHLASLEAQLATAATAAIATAAAPEQAQPPRLQLGDDEAAAEAGCLCTGTPELVPFTDFDPTLAGGGELLGGLEDEDEAAGIDDDDDAAWLRYEDGPQGDSGGEEDGDGYDLDLGLDLDLDDGFGGGCEGLEGESQAEGSGAESGSDGGGSGDPRRGAAAAPGSGSLAAPAAAAGALPPLASPGELRALLECLAAAAAAATAATAAAAVDPAAAAAAAASQPGTGFSPDVAGGGGYAGWAAGPEARAARAARLQRLAAYEWMHEHHLLQALPADDPRVGQAIAQFFAAQAADPLQPSARGITAGSRLALLTQLQSGLDALPALEGAVSGWDAAAGGAVSRVVALLRGAPERFPVDTAVAAQRAGALTARRQQWLAESRAVVTRVCQVAEALLQFEYSRQGITWASGGAAVADGFAPHCQLLSRAEVIATLAGGGSEAERAAAAAEASQRGAEAARKAADARYALELAQYEEVAASSQLQAHLPLLVSRSLELGAAVAEAEPLVKSLVQLLSSKMGPALKELSSVSAQHAAAADVASVAAAVTAHFERSRQAAEALAEALPAVQAALATADATAPLPADMSTEVGFLSAQLLGGPEAAAATRERAMALLQHSAAPAAALQSVMHTVLELPRALGQLNSKLSALAAAAGSIAAAVESKHLVPTALEEQPQQQQQQTPQQTQQQPGQSDARITSGATPEQQQHSADGTMSQARMPADAEAAEGGFLMDDPSPSPSPSPSAAATGAALLGPASTPGAGPGLTLAKAISASASTAMATAIRLPAPQRRAAAAAAADHVQHHRSRRSAADEARRRAFAAGALRRFVAKLEGREGEGVVGAAAAMAAAPPPAQQLSISEQVDLLVRQATSAERLSQMYEGWTAWL